MAKKKKINIPVMCVDVGCFEEGTGFMFSIAKDGTLLDVVKIEGMKTKHDDKEIANALLKHINKDLKKEFKKRKKYARK